MTPLCGKGGSALKIHMKKQLKRTALFLILIGVFTGAGLWFRSHPLFTEEGGSWEKKITMPVNTYIPYEFDAVPAAQPVPAPLSAGEPADAAPRFYTIERASVFTFSGLGNEEELRSVLAALERTGSHATFFVTAEEMETCPGQIEEICAAGQHLGIGVIPLNSDSADALLKTLQTQAESLRERYGADYELFVRPTRSSGISALLEAAARGGFRVLTQLKEAIPEDVSRMTDAEEILSAVFRKNEGKLQRGESVHFQRGIFQHSDTVLGDLVERTVAEKCVYPILFADEIAKNTQLQYSYPLSEDQILPSVKDRIHPGYLDGKTPEEIFEIIRSGYIGNYWVSPPKSFPGFTEKEARLMDRTGIIENDENYVFLTFDDWGTDENIDKLLAVLEKHNVTATFFVRSYYVPNNPNLLRAIAAAGHTIGAHTHTHMPLSVETAPNQYAALSPEECQALEEDLVLCYDTLQSIVGDMTDADGKPSLSRLFRQPTLAVSKSGLETVFDCGFTHAVAGYFTASDYAAYSVRWLVNYLKQNIRSGAVIVMHFSDNARYTAEALDILLTEYETRGIKYQFVGLNKVLD